MDTKKEDSKQDIAQLASDGFWNLLEPSSYEKLAKHYQSYLPEEMEPSQDPLHWQQSLVQQISERELSSSQVKVLIQAVKRIHLQEANTIRLWIHDCGSGLSTYYIAALILEEYPEKDVQLFSTEITPTFLEKARKGVYSAGELSSLPPSTVKSYFVETSPGNWSPTKKLRSTILFSRYILLQEPPFIHLHGIIGTPWFSFLYPNHQVELLAQYQNGLEKTGFLVFLHQKPRDQVLNYLQESQDHSGIYYPKNSEGKKSSFSPDQLKTHEGKDYSGIRKEVKVQARKKQEARGLMNLEISHKENRMALQKLQALQEDLLQKEEALALRESYLEAMLQNSLQSFFLMDQDHHLITFNTTAEHLMHRFLKKKIRAGDSMLEVLSTGEWERLKKALISATDGQEKVGELVITLENGGSHYFMYQCCPVRNSNGILSSFSLGIVDQNNGQHSNHKLKEAEYFLKALFEENSLALCLCEDQGEIKEFNQAFLSLFSGGEKGLKAHHFWEHFQLPGKKKEKQLDFTSLQGVERKIQVKNSKMFWASARKVEGYNGESFWLISLRKSSENQEVKNIIKEAHKTAQLVTWEWLPQKDRLVFSEEINELIPSLKADKAVSWQAFTQHFKDHSVSMLRSFIGSLGKKNNHFELDLKVLHPLKDKLSFRIIGKWSQDKGVEVIRGSLQNVSTKKQLEERLEAITNNIPGVVFRYKRYPDGRDGLTFVSQGAKEMWGISAEEAIANNQKVWDLYHPQDYKSHLKSIEESAKNLSPWKHEWRIFHPNGELHWHRGLGMPSLEADGSIVWDSIILNISKEKKEEQRLRLMESVITHAGDAVLVTEAEPIEAPGPRIVYTNKAFSEMTGYQAEEVIGKSPRFLQGAKTDKQELKRLKKALQNWEACEIEVVNYKKSGEEFWINMNIKPLADDKGWFTHWISIEKDVTERKFREGLKSLQNEIGDIFNQSTYLDKIGSRMLEAIRNFSGAQCSSLWFYTNGKNLLEKEMPDYINSEKGTVHQLIDEDILEEINITHESQQIFRNTNENGRVTLCLPIWHQKKYLASLHFIWHAVYPVLYQASLEKQLLEFSQFLGEEIVRKELEEELYEIFTHAPDSICLTDSKGFITKANPALVNFLKTDQKNLLNTQLSNWVYAEDRKSFKEYLDRKRKKEDHGYVELRMEVSPGELRWLRWSTQRSRDKDRMLHAAQDISETKNLQELLESAYEVSKIGFWEANLETNEMYWSKTTRNIHEVMDQSNPSTEEALAFFKPGENREKIQQMAGEVVRKGGMWDEELLIVTAKGKEKWIRTIGRGEFHGGKCIKLLGSFQDIHERKVIELAYGKAVQEKNQILDSISDAFYALDEHWNFTFFNPQAELLFNHSSSKVIGKNIWEVFPEDRKTIFQKHFEKVFSEKQAANFEFFYTSQNSWFNVSVYPGSQGLSVYFINISEKKSIQKLLKEAFEEKSSILESISDSFIALDKDWNISYWNKGAEETLGLSKEESIGKNIGDIFPLEESSTFQHQFHKALTSQQSVHFEEFYTPMNRWFDISAYPSTKGLSIFFKDITHRKDNEKRLKQLNKDLKAQARALSISNAELEQFAFVASHDLQEPLRMITSFLSQLERRYKDQLDDRGKTYIHYATDGAQRMRRIILDLLDYSRAGRKEMEISLISIEEVIQEVISLQKMSIEESKAMISWGFLPRIRACKIPLQQVFMNLIGNAIKYKKVDQAPCIHISASEKQYHWEFRIEDNGMGIPERQHEKIFIIFQRLHNREEYAGTGLGLSICKKIILQHGGDIWVESDGENGSTFVFTIEKQNQKND